MEDRPEGCQPQDCCGDPSAHLPPSLEARAEQAAENAQCQRCKVLILSDSSKEGVVFGRMTAPLSAARYSYQLCGKCGLGLREYVFPEILGDRTYQEIKRRLLTEHWT